jgi:VIT1/CCC1 family predicted Fe2+/Mn2+ transporter
MSIADYIGKYWAGAEVMYGIIITMTFTCIFREHLADLDLVLNKVILAALLCCIAWGIADGFFYLWERNYIINRENRIIEASRSGSRSDSARSLIGEELDDTILRTIPPENRLQLYDMLIQYLSTVDTREKLSQRDAITIVLGTFMLSAGAGLVVVTPFFFINDIRQALIISNIVGILLLFCVGYSRALDRSFYSKLRLGFASSCIGIIIAGITIVLGG